MSNSNKSIIILIGPPGSGKGTQSLLLSKKYNVPSLSTGEVLRSFISDINSSNTNNSAAKVGQNHNEIRLINPSDQDQSKNKILASKIKSVIDAGSLVDDDLVTQIIAERIKHQDCQNGFILDGFPRNIEQAKQLNEILNQYSISTKSITIAHIYLDNQELLKRLGGRFLCKNCKRSYNKYLLPPKNEGVCDSCGSTEFIYRNDDTEEVITKRIVVYHEETKPLIDFYKEYRGFISIDGMQSIDDVFKSIVKNISQAF